MAFAATAQGGSLMIHENGYPRKSLSNVSPFVPQIAELINPACSLHVRAVSLPESALRGSDIRLFPAHETRKGTAAMDGIFQIGDNGTSASLSVARSDNFRILHGMPNTVSNNNFRALTRKDKFLAVCQSIALVPDVLKHVKSSDEMDVLAEITHAANHLLVNGNGRSELDIAVANAFKKEKGSHWRQCIANFLKKYPMRADPNNAKFSFIDLFAGVGGIRIAMQDAGGKCVFSSEIDTDSKVTYFRNFGEVPFGDINRFAGAEMTVDEIGRLVPDHDVLAGGFPCQPFSSAGVSSRSSLGRPHGFECQTQGTLFFNIARIVSVKKPRVVFLENVKNLVRHEGGKTISIIKATLTALGYNVNIRVINSQTEVPQKRERCFIVAVRNECGSFEFPSFDGNPLPLASILEKSVPAKYTISEKAWIGHQERSVRNKRRGAGFTVTLADIAKPANTILARYYKDGKECLLPQEGMPPRKLTPREIARVQGFPEHFKIHDADCKAYKQFGNSVPVPVVAKIAKAIAGLIV